MFVANHLYMSNLLYFVVVNFVEDSQLPKLPCKRKLIFAIESKDTNQATPRRKRKLIRPVSYTLKCIMVASW